jgi:5-methylcytosine-specific restriction endonuclease McrA
MKKHIKIYTQYFDLGEQSLITCEVCGKMGRIDHGGFDVHHITGRGNGKDEINNLMGLCRKCHRRAHEGIIDKLVYQANHQMFLNNYRSTL